MERINLSDFKSVSKFKIIDGVFSKVAKRLEGKELEFYGINSDIMEELKGKEVTDNDLEFMFNLIPVISNVDTDITFVEFEKMCKIPSIQFAGYMDLLVVHFKELFETAKKFEDLNKSVITTVKDLGLETPKTKEEILEDLYKELESVKDKLKKREIIKKISELDAINE